MQRADETQSDVAFAAGPSEVIPEEAQRVLGSGRALRLRLVLGEGPEAFDLGSPPAKPEHRGKVVEQLVAVERAGEDPEFDHPVGKELLEVDHPPSALAGSHRLEARVRSAFHLANQRSHVVAQRVAVAVQVASGARLAVEAHGVPACDVGELAGVFAHRLRVVRADDGFDAHGDVAAAGPVDVRADGPRPFEELEQVGHPVAALEDGRDEFAGHAARVGADRRVAFGLPVVAVEAGRVERQAGGGGHARADVGAIVVASDNDSAGGGDGGFEFDAEGDGFGPGILRFHLGIR